MRNIFDEIDKQQREINSRRPLAPLEAKQLREYFKIGVTYSSNAIEGNSLTETETKVVIEDGLTIGGKPLNDVFEALGHAEAFDFIHSISKKSGVTEEEIKKIHQLFYYRIDSANAGKYRKVKVFISGSKHALPPPEKVPALMKRLVPALAKLQKGKHPVECAALTHKEFVFIHPFVDGNGRVARLLMNLVLLRNGYTIAIILPARRADYIRTLEKAHTDSKDFTQFIAESALETQKDYLRLLKA